MKQRRWRPLGERQIHLDVPTVKHQATVEETDTLSCCHCKNSKTLCWETVRSGLVAHAHNTALGREVSLR